MLAASPTLDAWLDQQILQGRPGFAERARSSPRSRVPALPGPILVLCRSSATANSVRAWAARRTGVPGLDIVTPTALAHQLEGPWLDVEEPGPTVLPSTPFAERIRSRPGLVALARQRVRELRLCRTAEPATPAPEWLETLAESEWFTDTHLERRLLELARANGPTLTASLTWSRVVVLGFDVPVDPWTTAVVRALAGQHTPESLPLGTLDAASVVPDTAAEARVAALHAAAAPHDTLVLVQHDATAARVHRALLRNGIPSAWRPPARLERHTLASVIRRAVPWFAGPADPPIRAVDLDFVLRHPMVDSRLPPPAQEWLESRLRGLLDDDDPEAPVNTRLSPREVAKIIKRARHLDAPLSRWIEELDALSHRTDPEQHKTASRALRLVARLRVLQACVRGDTFRETFSSDAPEEEADWGDFDALVANLLGDQDPTALPEIPAGGTLGALRRFLLACRVRTREDPASLRILGALRRGSEQPATRASALELLFGTVDRGEVRPGVEILSYDDYDGRPVGQLVLCDVHDQGVGARPAPDPLLTEAQLEALGVVHGRRRVTFRLEQLRRAVGQARSVQALVTRRDAMGRAVVAPVQLALTLSPAHPDGVGTYGLSMADLPESPSITALCAVPTATVPCPAPSAGPLQRHAVQASVEWARAGRGPVGARPEHQRAPGSPTLTHLLVTRPRPATWLLPWLGVSEGVPEAALPDGPDTQEWSVSRLFKPLSHCLYQAFARTVLRIDEPETIAEELDPKEIGNAVHHTLEHAALRGAWSVDGDVPAAREAFSDDLLKHTAASFDEAREAFGALSPARRAATEGLQERWAQHWERYVGSRVQRGLAGVPVDGAADTLVYFHWYLDAAVDALQHDGRSLSADVQRSPYALKKWIKAQAGEFSRGYRPQNERDLCAPPGAALPGAWAPVLEGFVQSRTFARVARLWHLARTLSHALKAPTRATVAELPFGERGEAVPFGTIDDQSPVHIGPVRLTLGEEEVSVQGIIDRITVVDGPEGPLLRIVDYKTGRFAPSEKNGRRWLTQLVEPQLVIYALVVEKALADGVFPDSLSNAQLATIGWDHLRVTDAKRTLRPALDSYLVDPATLNLLGRALGVLVGRARSGDWLLSPRSDTCPAMTKWGSDYCPVAGACRIRDVDQGLPDPDSVPAAAGGPQ